VSGLFYPETVRVIDSHTEGEATRVVVEGWPAPAGADMRARRDDVRRRFDHLRRAIIHEPRGHPAMVGALLTDPVTPGAIAGVIFFNNVGYLGMCGHGVIGVARTLLHLGWLARGTNMLDTPGGVVETVLNDDGAVTIRNVVSYCHARDVTVHVPGVGAVTGDIAYGGNWFFIAHVPGLTLELWNVAALSHATSAVMRALSEAGITGADGAAIDHIELTAPPVTPGTDARNFVLCPGGEYDRSPCGTGTSAKLAVLHARGDLRAGEVWRQESVTGGVFDAWLEEAPEGLVPYIRGRAFITAEAILWLDPADPLRGGLGTP
jgi:4-hydroxyproline epimerase